jgi:hypothetical protein
MNDFHSNQIGTAWHGHHLVFVRCNPFTNKFHKIDSSLHAPTEPPHENCAETIAQYYSIGYRLVAVSQISPYEVQYILVL